MAHRIRALKNSNSASPVRDTLETPPQKIDSLIPPSQKYETKQLAPEPDNIFDFQHQQPTRSPKSHVVEVPFSNILGGLGNKNLNTILAPCGSVGSDSSTASSCSTSPLKSRPSRSPRSRFSDNPIGVGNTTNDSGESTSNMSVNSPLAYRGIAGVVSFTHSTGGGVVGGGGTGGGGGGGATSRVLSNTSNILDNTIRSNNQNNTSIDLSQSDVRPLPLRSPSSGPPVIDFESQNSHLRSLARGRAGSSKTDNSSMINLANSTNTNASANTAQSFTLSLQQSINPVLSTSTQLGDTYGRGLVSQSSLNNINNPSTANAMPPTTHIASTGVVTVGGGLASFEVPPSMLLPPTNTSFNTAATASANSLNVQGILSDPDTPSFAPTKQIVVGSGMGGVGGASSFIAPQQLQPIHHARVPSTVHLSNGSRTLSPLTNTPQTSEQQQRPHQSRPQSQQPRIPSPFANHPQFGSRSPPPPSFDALGHGLMHSEGLISNIQIDDEDSDGDIDGVLMSVKPNKSNASVTTVPVFGKRGSSLASGSATPTTAIRFGEFKTPTTLLQNSLVQSQNSGTTSHHIMHSIGMTNGIIPTTSGPRASSLTTFSSNIQHNISGSQPMVHVKSSSMSGIHSNQSQQFFVMGNLSTQSSAGVNNINTGPALFGTRKGSGLIKRSQPNTKLAALLRSGANHMQGDEAEDAESEKTYLDEESPRAKSPLTSFDNRKEEPISIRPLMVLPHSSHFGESQNFSNNNSFASHSPKGGAGGRIHRHSTPLGTPSLSPQPVSTAPNPSTLTTCGQSLSLALNSSQKRESSYASEFGTLSQSSHNRIRTPSTSAHGVILSPQSRASLPPLHGGGSFAQPSIMRSPRTDMATFAPIQTLNSSGRQPSETMAFNNNSFGRAPAVPKSHLLPPIEESESDRSLAEDDESNPLHQIATDVLAREMEKNIKRLSHNVTPRLSLQKTHHHSNEETVPNVVQQIKDSEKNEDEGTDRGSDDTDTPTVIVIQNEVYDEDESDEGSDSDHSDGSEYSSGKRSPSSKKKKKMTAKEKHIRQLRVAEANAQWKAQMDENDEAQKSRDAGNLCTTPQSASISPRAVKISRQVSYASARTGDAAAESIDYGMENPLSSITGVLSGANFEVSSARGLEEMQLTTHHTYSVGSDQCSDHFPQSYHHRDSVSVQEGPNNVLLVLPTSTNNSFVTPPAYASHQGNCGLNETENAKQMPSVTFSSIQSSNANNNNMNKSSNQNVSNSDKSRVSCLKGSTHLQHQDQE